MDITIHTSFLAHDDPDASLAFHRDSLGFEVRSDVGNGKMRWITVGPASQPDTSILLAPPATDPGITDDERRTISEMMAKGTYASINPKSFSGYGGVVQAPDGAIWKVATSSKKDTGPASRQIDDIVLLLGVADVKASKRFYVDRGLAVKRSFGGKYVEFDTPGSHVKLALYGRRALAKDAGVSPEGTGSHRIVIGSDARPLTDPDGFAWEAASGRDGGPAEQIETR